MAARGPVIGSVDRAAFVVALGDRLRAAGVPVGLPALDTCTRALAVSPPDDLAALYWLTRVTLVQRAAELVVFDAVFDAVFRDEGSVPEGMAGSTWPAGPDRLRDEDAASAPGDAADTAGGGEALPWHTLPRRVEAAAGAAEGARVPDVAPSAVEALAEVPFADLDEDQLVLVGAWLEGALRHWPTRRSRRRVVHASGRRVALRETVAASRRTGWEAVELVRTRPAQRHRTVTMVVDVSRSMQPYSTAYLHLMRALARSGRAETFAFSTSLTRVTPALLHRSPQVAVALASEQVGDRYGGTRLASSLRALLRSRHGNALRGGVLVVASDGWDSEDPEELAAVLRKVRRRVHRLVWLNPRAAAPGFEPLVGSMAAALPFCDAFLPAHTASSVPAVLDAVLDDGRVSSRASRARTA